MTYTRTDDITVVTPVHLGRLNSYMYRLAVESVAAQTLAPAAHSVAVDVRREGAAPTRQRALEAVRTPWTAFLDSDDMFLPQHLEKLMAHARDTDADFVYSWFKILDVYGTIHEKDLVFPETHFTNPFDPTSHDTAIETTVTVLVRTELAQEVGMVALNRGEANSGEDRRFTLGCLDAGAKISHLVEKTWLWRHHNANTSGLPTKGDQDG